MKRFLALVLSAFFIMLSAPAKADFFGPGNYGGGFIGGDYVPELVRTPSDFGTVSRWYKPDGSSGTQAGTNFDVTSGQIVKLWDSSGNGVHPTQSTTAYGPLYVANCVNGYPCMDVGSGSGSQRRYLTYNNDDAFQNRAGVSTYIMRNIADSGIYIELLKWSENGSTSNMRVQIQTADNTRRLLKKGERLDADTLTQSTSGTGAYQQNTWEADQILDDFVNGNHKWYTGSGAYTSITNPISANYTSGGGGNSQNSTSDRFTLGSDGFYTAVSTAYIAEVVQFPAVHVWGQRIGMYNYLMKKYRPSLAPDLASITSQLARWEIRDNAKYITKDTVSTTTVSEILDRTGNGNTFAQATKGKQAALNTTKSIGATFTAANSHEYSLAAGKLGILKNQASVCSVFTFKPATAHTGYLFWFSEGTSPTSYRFAARTTAAGKLELYQRRLDGGSGFSLASSNSYDAGQQNLGAVCVNYTANTTKVVLNGTTTSGSAGSTGTFSNTDSLNATIGSSNGSNYFDGEIRLPGLLFTDDTQLNTALAWASWGFI